MGLYGRYWDAKGQKRQTHKTIPGKPALTPWFLQTSLMQLIRVMDQVSNLSLYANGIMSDLADASDFAIQRTEEVRKRLEAIKGAVPTVEEKLATAGLADSMNHERMCRWR